VPAVPLGESVNADYPPLFTTGNISREKICATASFLLRPLLYLIRNSERQVDISTEIRSAV